MLCHYLSIKKLNAQSVSKLHKRQKAEEKQFFFRLSKHKYENVTLEDMTLFWMKPFYGFG